MDKKLIGRYIVTDPDVCPVGPAPPTARDDAVPYSLLRYYRLNLKRLSPTGSSFILDGLPLGQGARP